MKDLYPSRYSTEVEITRRKDPVIHAGQGQENETPLTGEQLRSFEQNGFLFLDNFFQEEELEDMQQEIHHIQDEYDNKDAPEVLRESKGHDIRSVFAVHEQNELFKQVSLDRRLQNITQHLLGSDVYINQSRVNVKPPFEGKKFAWHSDFETWHVEDGMPRMRAVSVSVTLSDNYSFNGPLMFIPGSHRYFISCQGETTEGQEFGVPEHNSMTWLANHFGISVPTGPAGSVLLFDCNTMHGANGNITPFGQNDLFMVYNSVENKLVEPFSGNEPRPAFIAAREPELVLT